MQCRLKVAALLFLAICAECSEELCDCFALPSIVRCLHTGGGKGYEGSPGCAGFRPQEVAETSPPYLDASACHTKSAERGGFVAMCHIRHGSLLTPLDSCFDSGRFMGLAIWALCCLHGLSYAEDAACQECWEYI